MVRAGIFFPPTLKNGLGLTIHFLAWPSTWILRDDDFDSLMVRPARPSESFSRESCSFIPASVEVTMTRSSAKARYCNLDCPILSPRSVLSSETTQSITQLKRMGLSGSPCRTPWLHAIGAPLLLSTVIVVVPPV